MREHGLLEVSAPELLPQVGCTQNKWHRYDVWGHALACLDASVGDPILRLSALLHDVGKPATRAFSDKTQDYTFYDHERVGAEMIEPVLARLRFSNEERVRIAHLVRHHLVCYDSGWSDAAVRRWVRRIGVERLQDLYALNEADIRGKDKDKTPELAPLEELKARVAAILAKGEALSTRDLAIGGRELMQQLGMKPGPKMGMLLERLLEDVLEDPARNTPEQLLARSSEILPELPENKPQA
jgi:tRNA nucleotidyltransferase (CCA-adding enzyme)